MRSQLKDPELRRKGVARLHLRLQARAVQLPASCRRSNAPNVELVTDAIARIEPERHPHRRRPAARARLHRLGDRASGPATSCSRWRSLGARRSRAGRGLGAAARTRTSASTVPGFPNMFVMYGPNTNTSGGSIIVYLEAQAAYVRQALRAAARARRRRDRGARRGRGGQRPRAAGALRRDRLDALRLVVSRRSRAASSPTGRATCASTSSRRARSMPGEYEFRRTPAARSARVDQRRALTAAARSPPSGDERRALRLRDRRRRLGRLRARQPPVRGSRRCACCCSRPAARDRSPKIKIPAAFAEQFHTKLDWDYATEPEPHVDGRSLYVPRGKSARRLELDERDALRARSPARLRRVGGAGRAPAGATATCCPTSSSSEDNVRGASEFHGAGGPLQRLRAALAAAARPAAARRQRGGRDPADRRLQRPRAGRRVDVPGRRSSNGRRFSAADAFLRPALTRPNLELRTGVDACSGSSSRATARSVCACATAAAASELVRAAREVLLAAGAINSPQLLLLSGIGAADGARAAGVEPAPRAAAASGATCRTTRS